MSHTVERETRLTNVEAIKRAVGRIKGASVLGQGKAKFYSGSATGFQVKLPGWKYPVVVDLESGGIKFDNYNGRWGNPERLRDLEQGYAVEQNKMIAEEKGYSYTEETLENGDVHLQVKVGGGYDVAGGDSGGGPSTGGYDVAGPGS